MTTTTRNCANCSNFNPEPSGLDPTCWADVLLAAGTSQREPGPADYCELHSTYEEAADALYEAYSTDPEIQEIVRRQLACENELARIQNKAASEVITAGVLANLRNGCTQ